MGHATLLRSSSSMLLVVLVLLTSNLQQASALYHTSSELLHWFSHSAGKRPDILRFRELHERQTSTILPVATISKGISSSDHKPRPAVLFVFGEHARELITSEVGIWLARLLIDTNSSIYEWPELSAAFERAGIDASGRSLNSTDSSSSSSSSSSDSSPAAGKTDWPAVVRGWVDELLAAFEVVIVPIEALDSRRLVESGQLCVRKTASNVDLNRNWPFAWKKEAATEEQYGGPNPFSEPQSRLMKHLVDHLTGRLLGYVNVHSGEWALYTPWDSKEAYGPGLPADLPALVSKVGRLCDCKAGPAGAVSGYLAFGTSMDYLYVHKRVPYPLTVEVYGGGNIGKLAMRESNKDLTAWPTVSKSGAPVAASAQFQRRMQQQQEEGSLHRQLPLRRKLLGWVREVLQARPGAEGAQQQGLGTAGNSANQQQQQQRKGMRRRRRRRRPSKQLGLLPDVEAGPTTAAAAAAAAAPAAGDGAAAAAAGSGASGFSAGGNLVQLRQQAKQQLLQDQQQQSIGTVGVLSIPNDPQAAAWAQQGGGGDDAILDMVAAAQLHQRGCFDAFNPTDEIEYRRVIADWLAASVIMMKHMLVGEEGQRMIAQVAAGASVDSSTSSKGQQHSGISVHDPAAASSNSSTAGGH